MKLVSKQQTENKMAVLAERIFNKDSYMYGKRFNYGFMGSVLDMLKAFQYKYKREDVATIYRFVADVIEHGNFEWPGNFDLKPVQKNDNIETKKQIRKSRLFPKTQPQRKSNGGPRNRKRIRGVKF